MGLSERLGVADSAAVGVHDVVPEAPPPEPLFFQSKREKLPPIHPGEILLEDFMNPLGLSQYRVAKDIGVSSIRISQIVHSKRAVTADTAMRLGRYFGTSAEVWLRLQARYDLEIAREENGERIEQEVRALKAA